MATRTKTEYSEQDKIQQTDHDSLIRLEGKLDTLITDVQNLKNIDIKDLRDGMANRVTDLDQRVKKLEDVKIGAMWLMMAISIAFTLFGLYVRGFIETLWQHVYGH
jgi:hypothetical protein